VEKLPSGRLRYRVLGAVLLQEEMLHVRGASKDGVLGLSPLQIARGSLALALSQNETAAALVGNGLRPSGVMSYPDRLSPEVHAKVKASLTERFAGASNAGKVMVVDGGAKFEHLAWSPEDAEFLDNRRLANLDVARIFGCPPTTVGIPDHGTYSNQEQESTALVRNALGPLAARIEGALARCLLTPAQRRTLYIEHDLSALLRGDVKARFEAYRIGREIGALSPNDIRRRENEPPIPDGDTYHQPANWVPLGFSGAEALKS
jgi:HK97 family phage portal protein